MGRGQGRGVARGGACPQITQSKVPCRVRLNVGGKIQGPGGREVWREGGIGAEVLRPTGLVLQLWA